MRLTGRFAASYDSINLHWLTDTRNLARVAYDDRLLALSKIDRQKLPDLNADDLQAAVRTVLGTARSLGVEVAG